MIRLTEPTMKTYLFEIKYSRFRAMVGFVREYTLYDLAETLIEALGFQFVDYVEAVDDNPTAIIQELIRPTSIP